MNPGSLADWPLREQRPLFGLLGDVQAGHRRRADASLLMMPTKSVSGILFPSRGDLRQLPALPARRLPEPAGGV